MRFRGCIFVMISRHWNAFRITGPLWEELQSMGTYLLSGVFDELTRSRSGSRVNASLPRLFTIEEHLQVWRSKWANHQFLKRTHLKKYDSNENSWSMNCIMYMRVEFDHDHKCECIMVTSAGLQICNLNSVHEPQSPFCVILTSPTRTYNATDIQGLFGL